MNHRRLLGAVIASIALQTALPSTAAAEGWDVVLTPYLWTMGIDGDIQAHGQDIETSMDFQDIIDNMDIGGSALLEFNKGSWVNYVQVDYLAIDTGDVDTRIPGLDADLEMDSLLTTVATGYRIKSGERSSIDLMIGLRSARMDTTVNLQNIGQRDASNNLYDGIVALRPRLAISGNWYFSPTISVGAGDSDLTWELSPQFMYDHCGTEIRVGYRNLNYEFEKGSDSLDLSIHGPMIGVGFRF